MLKGLVTHTRVRVVRGFVNDYVSTTYTCHNPKYPASASESLISATAHKSYSSYDSVNNWDRPIESWERRRGKGWTTVLWIVLCCSTGAASYAEQYWDRWTANYFAPNMTNSSKKGCKGAKSMRVRGYEIQRWSQLLRNKLCFLSPTRIM